MTTEIIVNENNSGFNVHKKRIILIQNEFVCIIFHCTEKWLHIFFIFPILFFRVLAFITTATVTNMTVELNAVKEFCSTQRSTWFTNEHLETSPRI